MGGEFNRGYDRGYDRVRQDARDAPRERDVERFRDRDSGRDRDRDRDWDRDRDRDRDRPHLFDPNRRTGDRPRHDVPTERRVHVRDGADSSPVQGSSRVASSSTRSDAASGRASGKSSPGPTPSNPPKAALSNDSVDAHVRRVTDMLCERVFWYMQRDGADKKFKRLSSDADRCKASRSDFSSAFEIIKQQRDLAEGERTKACSRVEAADEKLRGAVQLLTSRFNRPIVDEPAKANPEGETTEKSALALESRLLALKRSIETDITKTLAENAFATKKTVEKQLESEIAERKAQNAELKAQLARERCRNDQLETKLDELGRKFDAMGEGSKRADQRESAKADPAKQINSPKADPNDRTKGAEAQGGQSIEVTAKILEATKELVTRDELDQALHLFDNSLSSAAEGLGDGQQPHSGTEPGEKTRRKLLSATEAIRCIKSSLQSRDLGDFLPCIQDIKREIDAHENSISKQASQQMEANSIMKTLESAVAKLSSDSSSKTLEKGVGQVSGPDQREQRSLPGAGTPTATANISDEHILNVARPQIDRRVQEITQKLGGFLDKERSKGEAVDRLAQQTASAASLIRSDLDGLKSEYTKSIKELGDQLVGQTAEVKVQEQKISNLEATLPAVRAEARNSNEVLALQVFTLQSWQENFSTRPLYKDIVDHIKATVPNGVLQQLNHLSTRVASVEVQLGVADGGAMKRRKLQHNGPGVANGLQ